MSLLWVSSLSSIKYTHRHAHTLFFGSQSLPNVLSQYAICPTLYLNCSFLFSCWQAITSSLFNLFLTILFFTRSLWEIQATGIRHTTVFSDLQWICNKFAIHRRHLYLQRYFFICWAFFTFILLSQASYILLEQALAQSQAVSNWEVEGGCEGEPGYRCSTGWRK